jgi:hypothetical protein
MSRKDVSSAKPTGCTGLIDELLQLPGNSSGTPDKKKETLLRLRKECETKENWLKSKEKDLDELYDAQSKADQVYDRLSTEVD